MKYESLYSSFVAAHIYIYICSAVTQIISQTHFFRALRIFMDTPHCTQVLMGLGQPFPFTVIPSSSSLYAFTSGFITTSQTGSVSRVAQGLKNKNKKHPLQPLQTHHP